MCLGWGNFVWVVRRQDLLIWDRNLNNYELRMTEFNYDFLHCVMAHAKTQRKYFDRITGLQDLLDEGLGGNH